LLRGNAFKRGYKVSYQKDLDEYTEEQLNNELTRRKKLRQRGRCDYCERVPATPPCRFSYRHRDERITPPVTAGVVYINAVPAFGSGRLAELSHNPHFAGDAPEAPGGGC